MNSKRKPITMKNLILSLAILLVAPFFISAQAPTATPTERTITVTGMAELEIIPDEIYVYVSLREFTRDKKKFSIEELESTFLNFVEKTAGTPRTDVKMDNTSARIIAMKRRTKDAIIDKSYEVKFKNNEQVMLLFTSSDSLNISSVYISRYSHSKIDEYKQQIRVSAMKDAKNKATYMLAAIDQKAGKVITVYEINPAVSIDDDEGRQNNRNFNMKSSYGLAGKWYYEEDRSGSTPIVKTIKLRYQVQTTFEIS